MLNTDIAIVGGGPAGMCAALTAANQGARVALFERGKTLGGQLVKQTHRFFGSEKEYAGMRGIQIAAMLEEEIKKTDSIDVHTDATVLAMYNNNSVAFEEGEKYDYMIFKKVIVAAGASEKMLAFPNNDLPGVYGAGAVQTLMNVHGVVPGQKVLMVGSGNIGVIVSYQLMQAGIKVVAVIEGAPEIGGYKVHASKLRRMGVPILTSHTILKACGKDCVEGAVICKIDETWQPIPGTEKRLEVDVICLSVGLSPLVELLWQIGCEMKFVPQLGGYVPVRDKNMETSVSGVYVAGDSSGIEEASIAMIEGKVAGVAAAEALGYNKEVKRLKEEYMDDLKILRSGPVGEKIREGIHMLIGSEG